MIKYVILLSLILSLISCSYKNNFTLYKQKPIQTKSESLRIDGVFTNTSKERPDSLYFYTDGTIGLVSFGYGGNSQPIGHYIIKEDSLLGQYFGRDAGGSTQRYIKEIYGKISNDTTIIIYAEKCDFCVGAYAGWDKSPFKYYNPPLEYSFSENIKPDSSTAWFKKRKWYIKNVWYNNE